MRIHFSSVFACSALATQLILPGCGESAYQGPKDGLPEESTQSLPENTFAETSPEDDLQKAKLTTGVPTCLQGQKLRVELPYAAIELADTTSLLSKDLDPNSWTNLYDALLRQIVSPDDGLVDYGLAASDLKQTVDHLHTQLNTMAWPNAADKNEWSAFWLNVYNLSMIRLIAAKPAAKNIETEGLTDELFNGAAVSVAGETLSLNEIEYCLTKLAGNCARTTIQGQTAADYPYDPRLHVGYVCAAVSCPKLRNFAYRSSNVNQVLEENLYLFFNDTRHVSSSDSKVSALFHWFDADFQAIQDLAGAPLIETYVQDSCRSDKATLTSQFAGVSSFKELQRATYDWTINRK